MTKKKILIVEDERIIAEDLNRTLKRLGYEVSGIASSGSEALRKASATIPDLAIMDIMLKGKMDGISVAERLKDLYNIPSIYLTAYADETILKRAKISAPFSYILKPFDEKELHSNVEIALERSRINKLLLRTNKILNTVRNINQLIVRERDQHELIKQACKILTSEMSYPRAWIILLDNKRQLVASAQSGWGEKFKWMLRILKKGVIPDCGLNALKSDDVVTRKNSPLCRNCPFKELHLIYDNLTIPLSLHDKTYGLLSVVLPERVPVEQSELDLFRELAGDIAFGLHDLELESKRRHLETELHESETRFKTLSESAAEAIAIHDKGVILDVNQMYCQMFGYEHKEVIGMNALDFAAQESKDMIFENIKRGYEKPYEATGLRKDGSTFIGEVLGKPIPYQGRTVRATVIRDITFRKQMEKTLQLIMEGTSTATGTDFFNDLVRCIAQVMGVEIAFITRLNGTKPRVVESIAMWIKDELVDNSKWEIKNTPCKQVITGRTVIVPHDVQQKFPKDSWLQKVRAESYLAVPILDVDGKVVGHMGVLDSKPMEDPKRLESIIQIFAVRAGTELQRLQTEEELESIFTSNPLPIITLDNNLTIYHSNTAAQEYCQMKAEEIEGQHLGDVLLCSHRLDDPRGCGFSPDCKTCIARNTILDTFQDQQTRQGVEFEMIRRINGKLQISTISLNTSHFDTLLGGPQVMIVFDDITRQKKVQEETARLKEFNESVLTGVMEGIVVMDAEGIMEYVNPASEALLGYTKTELEGQHWSKIIPKDQHHIVHTVDERRMKGESSVYDLQLVRQDGQRIDVIVSGSPRFKDNEFIGTMALFTDITDRKRAEDELNRSKVNLEAAQRIAHVGSWEWNIVDNTGKWSDETYRIFGMEPHDLVEHKQNFLDKVHPDDRARVNQALSDAISGAKAYDIEYRINLSDGIERVVHARGVTIRDDNGKALLIQGTVHDITEHVRAEEKIRESHELLQKTYDTLLDAIITLDASRNIISCNKSVHSIFGYDPEELIGKKYSILIAKKMLEDPDRKAREEELLKKGYLESENFYFRKKNGQTFPASFSMALTRDNQGLVTGMVGSIHDITKRKQSEEELRASEERYRSILESIEEGYYEVDLKGNFTFFNDALCKMLNYSRDELLGMNNRQYMDKESASKIYKAFNQVYKTGKSSKSIDFKIKRKDGVVRYGEISISLLIGRNNKPVGFRGIVRDITERKQAEDKIRESEESYRGLYNNATDAIYIQDKKGRFLDVNQSAVEMYGYPREYFIGKTPEPLSAPGKNDMGKIAGFIKKAFKGVPQQFEFWGKRKNGEVFPKIVRLNKSRYFGQDVVIAFAIDISDEKRAEENLRKKMHDLDRANKLMIGRELRMIELKSEVNELLEKVEQPRKYTIPDELE